MSAEFKPITPTKYVLLVDGGVIFLRGMTKDTPRGYFNVDTVRMVTGKSLDPFRKHGRKLAKHWNVEFEDRTVRS